ncbi:MAG: DUF4349 domain-containing protein [Chloroflexota bacterium]|nr:DUF4349 domain-containing protein [Chloroflexota bacterium]
MNRIRFLTLMCTFIVAAVAAVACGAQRSESVIENAIIGAEGERIIETVVVEVAAEMPAPVEEPASSADMVYPAPSSGGGNLALAPQGQRMVIKDADMDLLVDNTEIALDKVTQMSADYGGYIISAQTWYKDDHKFATVRMGIPSTSFEVVLKNLRNVGIKVLNETASGEDITAQYVDLESRLKNLEATAERVRGFLDEAKTVEEALKVNDQLSRLEQDIEQIKGQMRFYEGRSAFSTITVSLTPQFPTPTPTVTPTPTPTPTPAPGWNPINTLDKSSGVLTTVLKGTIDILIWLVVVVGPFLIVGLLIILVVRLFLKRTGKKSESVSDEKVNMEK